MSAGVKQLQCAFENARKTSGFRPLKNGKSRAQDDSWRGGILLGALRHILLETHRVGRRRPGRSRWSISGRKVVGNKIFARPPSDGFGTGGDQGCSRLFRG